MYSSSYSLVLSACSGSKNTSLPLLGCQDSSVSRPSHRVDVLALLTHTHLSCSSASKARVEVRAQLLAGNLNGDTRSRKANCVIREPKVGQGGRDYTLCVARVPRAGTLTDPGIHRAPVAAALQHAKRGMARPSEARRSLRFSLEILRVFVGAPKILNRIGVKNWG